MKKCDKAMQKPDRKTMEKNRRIHMKSLCFKLASLIPNQNPKEVLTQLDQLDHAIVYINKLRDRMEQCNKKKQLLMSSNGDSMMIGSRIPILELRELGSALEVILITGLNNKFHFNEVIGLLEEEGVEVLHASFSVVDDKIFHTIHSQVTSPRIGVEISRVHERLKKLVY